MFPSGLFDRKPTTAMSAFYDPNLEKHPKIIRSQFGQKYDVKKSAYIYPEGASILSDELTEIFKFYV